MKRVVAAIVVTMAPAAAFAAADLAITKIADRTTVPIGQNITFTITLANLGPGAATDVVFGDPLPDPLNLVSFACSEGEVISSSYCGVDIVPAGHQVTITLVATPITNPAPGGDYNFQNTAFILASGTADPVSSNNQDTVMMHLEAPALRCGTRRTQRADAAMDRRAGWRRALRVRAVAIRIATRTRDLRCARPPAGHPRDRRLCSRDACRPLGLTHCGPAPCSGHLLGSLPHFCRHHRTQVPAHPLASDAIVLDSRAPAASSR